MMTSAFSQVESPLSWTEPDRPGIRNVTAPGGLVVCAVGSGDQLIPCLRAIAGAPLDQRLRAPGVRTVSSHLYRSYPKLGVAGRHQLRDVIARASSSAAD
jgi:hypothetical protein